MIQNAAALSLSKGQLKLQNDEGAFTLPIEDITALILESPQITLSSTLLSACQEHGVAVLTCDATHMPNGALLPFQPHSRLWQSVIQSKITNQATCLEQTTDEETAKRLYVIAQRVKSGDPDNIEAQAARYYWQRLLGDDFRRGGSDIINAALNYGYAVLRAFVARSQVAYGLLPTFGIHHCNQLNAYNLTDDLMEVFRPFTDYQVFSMRRDGLLEAGTDRLSKEARAALANIGNITCRIDGNTHTIANACDKMAAGLVNAIEGKSPALLLLPEFEIRNKTQ